MRRCLLLLFAACRSHAFDADASADQESVGECLYGHVPANPRPCTTNADCTEEENCLPERSGTCAAPKTDHVCWPIDPCVQCSNLVVDYCGCNGEKITQGNCIPSLTDLTYEPWPCKDAASDGQSAGD